MLRIQSKITDTTDQSQTRLTADLIKPAFIGEFELFGFICKLFEYFKCAGHLYSTLVETTYVV